MTEAADNVESKDDDVEEKNRSVFIDPGRMKLAQYERQDWVANAPPGTIQKDLVNPSFWALMAYQMKPYDRIEVRADDGTWVTELLVVGCDRNWANVVVLAHHKLTGIDDAMVNSSKLELKWMGPHRKWAIIRRADSAVIEDQIADKDTAVMHMRDREKVVA